MTNEDRSQLLWDLREAMVAEDDQEVIDRALWHLAGHVARKERLAICKCGLTRGQQVDHYRIDRTPEPEAI